MDEEDIRERDEVLQISTTDGFAGFGMTEDPNAKHALDDIFRPAEDTMGEKLLNRMGWKKGQGIGPRIRRKINLNDPDSEIREYPPEDVVMVVYPTKRDNKGFGFGNDAASLLRPHSEPKHQDRFEDDELRPGLSFMATRKPQARRPVKSGIGVGSLNDTGSDDEDAYEMGPKMSYNLVMGGDKKSKKKKAATTSNANPLLTNKPLFIPKSKQLPSMLDSLRKCHDGKLPLPGFVLGDELESFATLDLSDEKHKPDEVPEGWQPAGLATEDDPLRSGANATKAEKEVQQTAESRRRALNEKPLPSKSVFDFLSPAARDRLTTATGNAKLPPALNEAPPTKGSRVIPLNEPELAYPHIDPVTATAALQRLRQDKQSTTPYIEDLPKQTRYKDYLRWSADPLLPGQRVPPLRSPLHKLDDEHLAELNEFAATAELFKPATGFLASRFTSAIATNEGDDGEGPDGNNTELLSRSAPKPTDPAEEAARMGMFGIATRSTKSWMPTRLVCKRFSVEMPIDFND